MTRAPVEATEHVKFGFERNVCRSPIDPEIAIQQLYDLTTMMGPHLSALLTAKFCNALPYRPIRFPNVDYGFAGKPTSALIFKINLDSWRDADRKFAWVAVLRGVAHTRNHIDARHCLGRVLGVALAEW